MRLLAQPCGDCLSRCSACFVLFASRSALWGLLESLLGMFCFIRSSLSLVIRCSAFFVLFAPRWALWELVGPPGPRSVWGQVDHYWPAC